MDSIQAQLKCNVCGTPIKAHPELFSLEDIEKMAYEQIRAWNKEVPAQGFSTQKMIAGAICSKFGTPKPKVPSVEEIQYVIIDLATHILHYHDKEGITTKEKVIHRASFKEVAKSIHNLMVKGDTPQ